MSKCSILKLGLRAQLTFKDQADFLIRRLPEKTISIITSALILSDIWIFSNWLKYFYFISDRDCRKQRRQTRAAICGFSVWRDWLSARLLVVVFALSLFSTAAFPSTINNLGPERVAAGLLATKSFTFDFSALQSSNIVLVITNGDGADHSPVKCSGNIQQRLISMAAG